MSQIEIRNFQENDMQLLKKFREYLTSEQKVVFWWVGPKENWQNVFCAFEDEQMIAKGQVQIVSEIPTGNTGHHKIFMNLKILPEREEDNNLYDSLYKLLLQRASELKQTLSSQNKTMLCVGNYSTEERNNSFFIRQGFEYIESIFSMQRDLDKPIGKFKIKAPYQFRYWEMATDMDKKEYLKVEAEIWPDSPLRLDRLIEYQNNPLWKALSVWRDNTLIGSVMVWKEDGQGCIEDLFVRDSDRKQGIAKYLLSEALFYLKGNGCKSAFLDVNTNNESALSLYVSVGFEQECEEVRYSKGI
ncbi:GNAT family N-acetyltransferase [Psychrobacillus sp. NPDC058041]|uniref:GNAT family N-acetyltransferase n=1 Tax=Psychrobacillus sp. NPDC058041 TaxID=3346310 RepID=UPI0036D792BB